MKPVLWAVAGLTVSAFGLFGSDARLKGRICAAEIEQPAVPAAAGQVPVASGAGQYDLAELASPHKS